MGPAVRVRPRCIMERTGVCVFYSIAYADRQDQTIAGCSLRGLHLMRCRSRATRPQCEVDDAVRMAFPVLLSFCVLGFIGLDGAGIRSTVCLLITGYATASTPSNQTWGFRSDIDELTLIMNVRQVEAVAGPEIALNIDGHEVGGVAVSGRPEPANGFSTAIAVVRDISLQKSIFGLLQRGGMVQLTNGKTTFSAALSKEVASDFQGCRRKAGLLS